MKQGSNYQNKKILVIGLGKSGASVAKLLVKLGANVTINDKQKPSDNQQIIGLEKLGIKVITGSHPLSLLDEQFELVVKNPGIPYDNPLVAGFIERKVPVITDVEVAATLFDGTLVGVTGSNGKTTTTTMITKMLTRQAENKVFDAGNIGIPISQVVQKTDSNDTIVVELSSFQLVGTKTLRPHIAVITNIFSNHLDYHKTRANYVNAKMKITANQTNSDYLVINWDNSEWQELSKQTKAQVIPFSRLGKSKSGAYESDGKLYWRDELIMNAAEIKVVGDHNIENALAAIAVAKIQGITTENIVHVLKTFGGVRHRMQFVLEDNGRQFYNDSKATDIEATQMALKGFQQPVILLAGGLDRGYTFEKLIPAFREHVKAIILFGEAADKLADAAKQAGVTHIVSTKDCTTGVPLAVKYSEAGDVILLSPANASWDQFPNFEVRGDTYIKAVEQLTGKKEE
ncbi:UDP-N-acetylmuramoyl-L-alanyl-D-glutamate synthetase [Paucilactobacillus hokkaidonensis JCM 18461]|uniref:UDP-N-acetylmuramoylalanine--D-glutamate ligase n=2 Tax=Paucilactobacillus hokkaidonensis TaxID=1193095 RepID=A0A0A1GUF2_9LACO|nr:UDP-N-acetylmuramoyl-L-alanine--D-glutamate ligase [Paucilactobacillus hokkaidonensis]KRO09936.1 UDP-N-acetylmuramoyl-L-alanyl-D-glutamate synthetase [Paucilactobacillus hokkaidonensis]BAP85917.1 UDP-N-acetylmuramoyl-L-alanyl-D-glutamate synthetase [Paucilactobacillus hokkaidonensis JCM 18461]